MSRSGQLNDKTRQLQELQAMMQAKMAAAQVQFAEGLKSCKETQQNLQWTQNRVRCVFRQMILSASPSASSNIFPAKSTSERRKNTLNNTPLRRRGTHLQSTTRRLPRQHQFHEFPSSFLYEFLSMIPLCFHLISRFESCGCRDELKIEARVIKHQVLVFFVSLYKFCPHPCHTCSANNLRSTHTLGTARTFRHRAGAGTPRFQPPGEHTAGAAGTLVAITPPITAPA